MPVFTGVVDGENDISERLERIELVASVCHWNEGAKLWSLDSEVELTLYTRHVHQMIVATTLSCLQSL